MSNLVNVSSLNPTPYTGVFGSGQFRFYTQNATFTVPAGITSVRVRLWGAGANGTSTGYGAVYGGGGGGFALRVITGLTPSSNVAITVGTGTSSFGAFVSATSGSAGGSGGNGSGGDINYQGGSSTSSGGFGGGGSASYFGRGGDGSQTTGRSGLGGAGGGGGGQSVELFAGGPGLTGASPGMNRVPGQGSLTVGAPVLFSSFSIDFIGTGPGGSGSSPGFNGGGGGGGPAGYNAGGGFPGGGAGSGSQAVGANGLVIVEY